jgi:hypothetical protein
VDIDPEYIPEDLDIRIISIIDDVDLGENSWISFDEGENGIAHAIIFYSDDVLIKGNNEENGFQINAYEMDYPHLPGLENNMANIVVSRNSFEKGENLDTIIPKDFIVEFDAEFFSTKNDGYKIIDDEAKIFRKLVENKPEYNLDFDDKTSDIEKHSLSIKVHHANSAPMGSSLSALFGKNFSYIVAELYKDDEYISSESAVRLPMKVMDDFDSSRLIKTILQSIRYFDWMNVSFYKKIIFSDIEEGEYVVKIFRENPFLSNEKQYIAFAVVDLNMDRDIDINCRSEGQINLLLTDQNENKVENAEVLLKNGNSIISKSITNAEGEADIRAPKNRDNYNLQVIYKGLPVYEDSVKINSLSILRPDTTFINIERYNIDLEIFDKWDLSPDIELNPILLNDLVNDQLIINSEKISDSKYLFKYIPKGDYKLILRFKSFIVEEQIQLNNDKNLKIEFPAEFKINIKTRNTRGVIYSDSIIYLSRDGKKIKLNENNNDFSNKVPPGEYKLEIYDDQELIYNDDIKVLSETKLDIVTNYDSLLQYVLLFFFVSLILLIILFSFYKKNIMISWTFIPIVLIFMSILFPWWMIEGSSNQITSITSMFLIPVELVTITTSSQIISGELAYLPDLFIMVINIFLIISLIGCIITLFSYYFNKNNNKKIFILFIIISLITFILSISMFIFALNELSSITVGSIIGQGDIESNIYLQNSNTALYSIWGFGIGFYIYLISISLILFNLIYFLKTNNGEEFRWRIREK